MRYTVALPLPGALESFDRASETLMECAAGIERSGLHGCCVTDHPAPDVEWLTSGGGHHSYDPFVALSFAAAATSTLRLQTYILVLAYRNPFLTAKSVSSLDAMCKGRLDLGVATGYLEPEFSSLGVDFTERNMLTDEAIEVLRQTSTGQTVAIRGHHFDSRGTAIRPMSFQQPHPPIWVGGNSQIAIRRAAMKAEGWIPLRTRGTRIPPRRTPPLETIDDLRQRIELLQEISEAANRQQPLDIMMQPFCLDGNGNYDKRELVDELSALSDLGITWIVFRPTVARTVAEYIEKVGQFAEIVL